MKLDNDKIDEAVLTLLLLGIHDGDRAWKGFDWESMNRLHEKAYGFLRERQQVTANVRRSD
jgi:hypothetical protein